MCILIINNIIATEQIQYITKCEIEWIKIKLKDAKDLLIGAFHMPHRDINDLSDLQKSIDIITMESEKISYYLAISIPLTLTGPTLLPKYMPMIQKFRNY